MKLGITFILIIVVAFTFNTLAQKPAKKITISGIVTDEGQKPIPGAIVFIDQQNTKITTDNNGFYKVKVRPDAKLISILTRMNGASEAQIDGRTAINFNFKGSATSQKANQSNRENDEKVNIGYGTRNRKDITTSVGKINGQQKFVSYRNIYEMISCEVPGVQVSGTSIMLQGKTSFNLTSEPLLVVDGIAVTSIDYILPQMVKSIEILKGASASIYGARGANGVILISLIGAVDKK